MTFEQREERVAGSHKPTMSFTTEAVLLSDDVTISTSIEHTLGVLYCHIMSIDSQEIPMVTMMTPLLVLNRSHIINILNED